VTVPSEMPIRQFPRPLRTRIRVAYATAWELLVNVHTEQARQFISEFSSRMTPLEALELYFAVAPISESMHEHVRTRTLSSLELDTLPPRAPLPVLRGWRLLRLDLVIKLVRYRRAYAEKSLELGRMVGARAAETITSAHIHNASDFAMLLRGQMSTEKAVGEYTRAFYLPLGTAQVVMQRVKASVAGSHLAAEYATTHPVPDPELLEEPAPAEPVWQPAPLAITTFDGTAELRE
jgi:hypothetical protein